MKNILENKSILTLVTMIEQSIQLQERIRENLKKVGIEL
jgi:hypothetical protein